jgi:hypothetical protein
MQCLSYLMSAVDKERNHSRSIPLYIIHTHTQISTLYTSTLFLVRVSQKNVLLYK